MHPAFSVIQFGPFSTSYHRRVVDESFREAFSIYLEKELLPQVARGSADGRSLLQIPAVLPNG